MESKRIKITRTLTYEGIVNWPEAYPDMTLDEAVAYEKELDIQDTLELFQYACDDERMEESVNVQVLD